MNDATRTLSLSRKLRNIVLHLSCGALLAGSLTGMGKVHHHPGHGHRHAKAVATAHASPVASSEAPAQSVTADSAPVTNPAPTATADTSELSAGMARVREWLADRYRVSATSLESVLASAEEEGRAKGIDPLLIVAVIAVESRFNPVAVSRGGAQGLMQVIPRYHRDKMEGQSGRTALFDPDLNVRVGTRILYEGISRFGSVHRALQFYNGSLGDPSQRYSRKVLAVKQQLVAAART